MNKTLTAAITMLCLTLTSLAGYAQESGGSSSSSTTSTTTTTSNGVDAGWLTDNWMWIAGAVVLLIIIIAALSSRSRTTRIERTTVIRDSQV